MIYDLIIIGAGPAGISAAIYAKRGNLNVLVLEKQYPGGLVNNSSVVENYLGFPKITGPELAALFKKHLEESGVLYKREEVIEIINGETKTVVTKKDKYQTRAILLAVGRSPKKLGLENEDKFYGQGISYCSLCDAPLFKHKNVAVYGGGNSAFEEGLYLAKFANNVVILNRGKELKADNLLQEQANKMDNIVIINECELTKINGNEYLESIEINHNETLNIDGLFIYIGYTPATSFLKNLDLTDHQGYIEVNSKYETKLKGIYAAGDIDKKGMCQIVTATAEGAIAAVDIIAKLDR